MPRYDFVDPYVGSHWTQDASESFDKVLESERMRRAEIEQKRRFDEQTEIQRGYLGEAQLRGKGDRVVQGMAGGDPDAFNPATGTAGFLQERAQEHDYGLIGANEQVGVRTDERRWDRDDSERLRRRGQAILAGASFNDAGVLMEDPGVYDRLNPGGGALGQQWWKDMTDYEGKWRERVARASNSGGSDDSWRVLSALGSVVDDARLREQRIRSEEPDLPRREYLPPTNPAHLPGPYKTPAAIAADSVFRSDSTARWSDYHSRLQEAIGTGDAADSRRKQFMQGMGILPQSVIDSTFRRPGTADTTTARVPAPVGAPPAARPSWLPSGQGADLTGQLPFRPAPSPYRAPVSHALPNKLEADLYGGAFAEGVREGYTPGFGRPQAATPAPTRRSSAPPTKADPIAAQAYPARKFNYKQELTNARRALAQGRDTAQVRAMFKQNTGKELP